MHGRSPLQHRCTNKEVYFLMNNLTTRKIVLGMLMALVLTFSVQGIAEALTFSTSRTGDIRRMHDQNIDVRFTIRFSVTQGKHVHRIKVTRIMIRICLTMIRTPKSVILGIQVDECRHRTWGTALGSRRLVTIISWTSP